METIVKPMPGILGLFICFLFFGAAAYFFIGVGGLYMALGFVSLCVGLFCLKGLLIINPNQSTVLNFFGNYSGTIKENGWFWVNPLYSTQSISLRAHNLESGRLKVNDKMGNPIEIAAVIVWQVDDTFKAAYDVVDYNDYIIKQSEAAVRHLANSFSYDNLEDEHAEITLRNGADKVNEMLETELRDRLSRAGIEIIEARISHLAYAPEIAGAMLQRQQATAVVAARAKIVEGAVGMVEMALEMLSNKQIVDLDKEKKAAMVSNLMVVLCSEKTMQPVLNTGFSGDITIK